MLLILGGNPVFTAPADLGFRAALRKGPDTRFHLGLYHDETAEQCHWHVPEAHYLESWGDVRAFDGTVSLIQPLIAPIYDGHTALEVLAAMNGAAVRRRWRSSRATGRARSAGRRRRHGRCATQGKPFANVDAFWRHALHDGFIASTSLLLLARRAGDAGRLRRRAARPVAGR